MRQILNTLYVMTPNAYVHLESDTLRIEVDRKKKMQCRCIESSLSINERTTFSKRRPLPLMQCFAVNP